MPKVHFKGKSRNHVCQNQFDGKVTKPFMSKSMFMKNHKNIYAGFRFKGKHKIIYAEIHFREKTSAREKNREASAARNTLYAKTLFYESRKIIYAKSHFKEKHKITDAKINFVERATARAAARASARAAASASPNLKNINELWPGREKYL